MSEPQPGWQLANDLLCVDPHGQPKRGACVFLNRFDGVQVNAYFGAWMQPFAPGGISIEMKSQAHDRDVSVRDELERLLAHSEACSEWLRELIATLPEELP